MKRILVLLPVLLAGYLFSSAQLQPADTCLDAYFHRLYRYREISLTPSITETRDKKLLWCGYASLYNTDGSDGDAVIAKLRNNGTVIWSKFVGDAFFDRFNRAKENRDKSIIAVGTTNISRFQGRNMFMSKLDSNGNLLWARKIEDPNTNSASLEGMDVAETNDGGYFVCATSFGGGQNGESMVMKTDANGNLLWFKQLGMISSYGPSNVTGVVLNNDTAYVTGWFIETPSQNGLLMKINANTGFIYWSKHYDYKIINGTTGNILSADNVFKNIYIHNGQLRINMLSRNNDPYQYWMINMDYEGNVLKTRRLATATLSTNTYSAEYPTADDGFISAASHFLNNQYVLSLVKIDADGNLAWSKAYTALKSKTTFGTFVNSNNDIFVTGYEVAPQSGSPFYNFLFKTDKNGDIPGSTCINYPFTGATIGSGNLLTADVNWQRSGYTNPVNVLINATSGNEIPTLTDECSKVFYCDQLKIADGVDSICNLKDTLQYSIQRNTGCSQPVIWTVDTTIVKITGITDSTIQLLFRKAGVTKLSVKLISACKVLEDSVTITGLESHGAIDLGPDIGICKQSELILSAGPGFKSYQWNDGSTDSTLTVINPGKYFVTAEDYCSNTYTDTIKVTPLSVPFDLGPDFGKCNNDTVAIIAPGNYLKYTWSPAYAISSTTSRHINVWPALDTSYSVVAEVARGCTVFDTIRITVKNSPPVYLGNDTSFCAGGSILLKAPGGFNSYSWQDGTTDQNYLADQVGFYRLLATYSNGCISKDTLEITNIYPLPVVDLGSDFDICTNEPHMFNAGNSYRSWLWQDGSEQSTFTAHQPGLYWVKVTDFNNCNNSDTVAITGIKPSPHNFAPSDTAICAGRPLELKTVGVYTSYLWSDHSVTPAITIMEPQDYWLEVTNEAGCTARDTIRVTAKDCKKGVYFPNAFTPNNNGKNDTYRPVVQGLVNKYRLIIYNRYGEKVFETTNYLQGWNGIHNGKQQDTNQYVWLCQYQFRGEKEQVERGTLLLLR
jgi:gliding motility-associated-like protein